MNQNQPYNEIDDDEKVVRVSLGERVGLIFSFLWYSRRLLMGVIMVIALAYGIFRVYMIPPQTFDEGPVLVVNDYLKDLPTANINFRPLLDESNPGDSNKPKIRTMDDIVLPDEKEVVPYSPLINEGSVDELIEAALDLREAWVGQPAPIAYLKCHRRARITRRLMDLELTLDQQIYALGDYVESLILLDKIVAEAKFSEPQIRVAIKEVVEKYSDHRHPIVRAKANLAAVLIPIHDFLNTSAATELEEFNNQIPGRLNFIVADPASAKRLAGMTLRLHEKSNWDGTVIPYCMEVVNRMEAYSDSEIREIGVGLRERLFFEHLEPNELVKRVGMGDVETRMVVQQYFSALEQNPNIRMPFFQVAVSTIETFKFHDKKQDYEALLTWLLKISTKVKSEAKRDQIEQAIRKLEALPFGGKTGSSEG